MSDCRGDLIDDCLLDGIECALEARDDVGAIKAKVYMVTRIWTGSNVGEGEYSDSTEQMLPSPGIQEYSHDLRVKPGGTVQAGDILLKSISRRKYTREQLELQIPGNQQYMEKFYKVCGKIYEAVSVKMNYATYDVLIRLIQGQQQQTSEPFDSSEIG